MRRACVLGVSRVTLTQKFVTCHPTNGSRASKQPTCTALLVCSNLYLPLHRAFNIGCIFTSRLLPLIMLRVAEQSLVVVIRVGREEERSMTVRYWN